MVTNRLAFQCYSVLALLVSLQTASCAYNTCVRCALGTSGVCKASGSSLCWQALPGDFGCPAPSIACDATGNVPRLISPLDSDGFPVYPPLPARRAPPKPCPSKRAVAYFPSPYAVWKPQAEHLNATGVNPYLFTHGVYHAAQINESAPYNVYYVADQEMPVINDFVKAVRQNPCGQAIISISTYYFDRASNPRLVWMKVASNARHRETFVKSAIMFARKTGFDGIELVHLARFVWLL
jgi:hypothetical protein